MKNGTRSVALAGSALLALVTIGTLSGAGHAGAASPDSLAAAAHRPAPSASVPTVTGPIAGKDATTFTSFPLSKLGYSQAEYFFSGTATSYVSAAPLTSSGKWSVTASTQAPYTSRMVVIRPTNPKKFSGTVVVEWFNVTSGMDAGVDWEFGHDQMMRTGDVYVGISAQSVGVSALKSANPTRYASLSHPGDAYSYDIFSQGGMAVRHLASKLMPGLHPKTVIADGESQSAIMMTTYVNAIAPVANVFDGYLIHSRTGGAASLTGDPSGDANTPTLVHTRTDQPVPVLTFASETDVLGVMHYYPAVQPDSKYFRLWEVTGTSHVDAYNISGSKDDGSLRWDRKQFAAMSHPPKGFTVDLPAGPLTLSCSGNLNTGEEHYVYQTALQDLIRWARTGIAPAPKPRFEINTAGAYPVYKHDKNGNVLGGVRTPAVDAPVAKLSGLSPAGAASYCVFFGQTHPLKAHRLKVLYPTHAAFVRDWRRAVARDLKRGNLLPTDARKLSAVV
jgi:hypothetical protein